VKRTLVALSALALSVRAHAQPQEVPPENPPPAAPAPASPEAPAPPPAPASPEPAGGAAALPLGVIVSLDLGGGGRLGGGSQYTPRGVFEAELTAGYEIAAGFRPELSLMLGVAPHTYAGLRLGLHYVIPETPFYARGALDASTESGTARWRWLLGGAGAEVRLTDVLGGFAEADLGIPLVSGAGVPVLVRAGVTFRI
jgi:hypothetical protein